MGGNVEIGAQLWVYCYTQALAMDGRPFRLAAEREKEPNGYQQAP